MKTAAIPYRVADFLKQHPPFEFMEEADLVALASRGRVKFHEPDEYICWQSSPHQAFFYVIQQGSVSLWDESVDPPMLRDILGAGDSVGLERFNGSPASLHSAKAATEVVLYALDAAELETLLGRYPHAARYVAAHSAVTAEFRAPGGRSLPHEILLADLADGEPSVPCPVSTSICEAARLLVKSGSTVLPLATGGERIAWLTPADVLRWVAAGAEDSAGPAHAIARAATASVAPQTPASECILAMARSRTDAAAVTDGGSPHAAIQGIITAAHLAPAFGDHPLTILQEIAAAQRLDRLAALNRRARDWILDHLTPSAVDWLSSFADLVNRRVLERLLPLTDHAGTSRLWCFGGAAGRQELLTGVAPRIVVIGDAPAPVEAALAECGYPAPEPAATATLDEWKQKFSGWIHDPIRTEFYHSRSLFDLRPVHGPGGVFQELQAHIRGELAAEPMFLRLLAHDCLANLPPLTFFRDLVVEESGERSKTFRLEASALRPLVDVARVFGLAAGAPLGASTGERFDQACRLLPAHEAVLREAAATMRVLLYHQARAGLRQRSSGAELPLSMLSRHDRQGLKSGFRALHRLLAFAAEGEWLEAI